jgi:hypothetical protein
VLENHGHEVPLLGAENAEISGALGQIGTDFAALHPLSGRRRLAAQVARLLLSVMHVHTILPPLSLSAFHAAQAQCIKNVGHAQG